MTDAELLMLIAYTAEVHQNYELPSGPALEVRLQVWRDFLGDLDLGSVRAAIGASGHEEFPPPPGKLRERALRLAGMNLPPDPDEAVAEILSAVSKIGNTGTPAWTHPAVGWTVEAVGGWQAVCRSTNPEALRAHLLKLYGSASERARRTETLAPTFAALVKSVPSDDPQLAAGPPAVSVSALRSPEVHDRDDDEGLRQLAEVRAALDAARDQDEEE